MLLRRVAVARSVELVKKQTKPRHLGRDRHWEGNLSAPAQNTQISTGPDPMLRTTIRPFCGELIMEGKREAPCRVPMSDAAKESKLASTQTPLRAQVVCWDATSRSSTSPIILRRQQASKDGRGGSYTSHTSFLPSPVLLAPGLRLERTWTALAFRFGQCAAP
ncbi:hypothetical protein MAPG_10400 [Magnaporthiopsis poae ATCC 64411]|uniref:Uncharacterized protein n=1 Tax=Magnaporthiopsis poae (strain ATCC 64411 / 73-15) TaxID=644358 RepID=A0A0C4ECH5_MAGP6|nr:hypothetical protein MAPG_10400 [Magnaporthiopsis poae ATCC 64411]